jgi:hypothetical protein
MESLAGAAARLALCVALFCNAVVLLGGLGLSGHRGSVGQIAGRPRLLRHNKVIPNLAVNTRPLTPKQKFELFASNSVSGLTLVGSAMGAGISQARDTYSGYGQGAEGYFKRFGAEMGFAASSNFFGTFMIASALHEDPRYFVQNSGKFGQSVKYAASRVFVCRMDDGRSGANWAGMLGPLGAAALSNAYVPVDEQGAGKTFERWGLALAVSAGTNLLREYWPSINKKLRLPNMGLTPSSTVEPSSAQPPAQPVQPPPPH